MIIDRRFKGEFCKTNQQVRSSCLYTNTNGRERRSRLINGDISRENEEEIIMTSHHVKSKPCTRLMSCRGHQHLNNQNHHHRMKQHYQFHPRSTILERLLYCRIDPLLVDMTRVQQATSSLVFLIVATLLLVSQMSVTVVNSEDDIVKVPSLHQQHQQLLSPDFHMLPNPGLSKQTRTTTLPLIDEDYMQEDQTMEEQEQDSFNQPLPPTEFIQQAIISASTNSKSMIINPANKDSDARSDTIDSGSGGGKSRGLLSQLDSRRLVLPQMQQIKARFNQGCVGGTKCQFFALCWMSGGSLGASCGLLMTCCVTPSRQEIQPGFYGPVVNDPYCGRSTSKINRIVGGTDASFGQFPWQAFVQVGGSRCGGALISSRHVVTAGHCVARFTPQADRYDVAVLELDRTALYKDNIKPICLPQKDAVFVGKTAYVAGWGALQAGSKLRPKVLQHVAVPVIENPVCESWHKTKGIDIRIYDEMMCAGYEIGQRDACQGDSGGPLMLNQYGVWYLVGIVSAGYSCAKQYQPGIYHRVSSSSDWISSKVYQQGAN